MSVAVAERWRDPPADLLIEPTKALATARPDILLYLAARLAALLARPVAYIDDAHCQLESFSATQVRAMAPHRFFRLPINRAVAANIGFSAKDIDAAMLGRFSASSSSRLAVTIVTAPIQEVGQVAWALACAVLSKRICAIVLKADRALARERLGAEGFDVATREVPVLYPHLGELDARQVAEPLFAQAADAAIERERVIALGFHALGAFLDASEPLLSELFALRLPSSAGYAERYQSIKRCTEIHCSQLVRFIRRRQPSWSATIG